MNDYVEYQYRLDTIVECCLATYSILNEASGSSIMEKFKTALLKGWQILKSLIDKLVAFIHRLVTGEKIYAATIKYDKDAIHAVYDAADAVCISLKSAYNVAKFGNKLGDMDYSYLVEVDETKINKLVNTVDNIQNWKEVSINTKKLNDDARNIQMRINIIDKYFGGTLTDEFLKIIYDNKEWYSPITIFKNKATKFLSYILEQLDTINSKHNVGEITIPVIKEAINKISKTHKSIKRIFCYRIGNSGIALYDADNPIKAILRIPGKLSEPVEKLFKKDDSLVFKL